MDMLTSVIDAELARKLRICLEDSVGRHLKAASFRYAKRPPLAVTK